MPGYLNADEDPFTDDGYYRTVTRPRDPTSASSTSRAAATPSRLSGFLVHPREIEAFIESLDGVEAAAVVEHEATRRVRRRRTEGVTEHCQSALADFKVPRRVIALDSSPQRRARTANGCSAPNSGAWPRSRSGIPPGHSNGSIRGSRPMSSLAEPDWEALARDPHFRELVVEPAPVRRARSPPSTSPYFLVFLALLGYAKDFMANEVLGISLALWGGFWICALTVVLAVVYARRAPEWERMAQRVVEEAGR